MCIISAIGGIDPKKKFVIKDSLFVVNNFVKNLLNENKKFEKISLSCIEKSKKYDWVKTSSNIEKEYELLLFK